MVEWLGKDFDGVIAFDEAHSMGNAIAIKGKRGVRRPSQQALAGINLQRELPNARVVYVSATGATEVSNLSYADRLGLWGEGTPFADVNEFVNGVSAGGIAAMELISRDMKAMGMYLARSLSYDGVTYERMEHTLSELQEDIYNELAGAWQIVLNNVEKALEMTQAGKSGPGKSAAMAQFWGAHQRFFNQIVTAMQTPAVIEHIQQQIDAGHAAVVQIVNTNEAAQERIIADATANDAALEDLDFTPRQMLMDYVRNGFPVAAFEESTDDNGNKIYVPVRDSEGNPVFDREAIALRDELLANLQHIRVPENPLDSLINAFGPDQVAEVTGRGRRFIQVRDDEGHLRVVEEKRGKNSSRVDAELFQADKKKLLVFSGAGGTGYSFHADHTAQNTRKRVHYILQPGWRADAAVQGFGRTHRTNQASEPHYVLPTTNLKAQKRFVSSIARRLDQLGALTRGQRQATGQGMFTASDNLESEYAKTALYNFFVDLYRERTPLRFQTVTRQMGLNLLDPDGAFEASRIPDIPQFLNRLLSLQTDQQNAVFDEFESRLVEAVEYAKQHGLYDEGLQTLRALSIHKTRDEVAYEDAKTGAQTRYVELAVTHALDYLEWDEIASMAKNRQQPGRLSGWFVREQGRNQGEVFFLDDRGERLDSEGTPVRRGVIYGIKKDAHRYIDNADVIHRGWEYRIVDGRSTKLTLTRQIDEAEAERLWKARLDAAPKTETTTTSMLVGVILPIWDRVEGAETIYRLQTDDGEQLLGRLLGPKAAQQTLKNLGLDSSAAKWSAAELFTAIQAGQRAILSNGWEISLSTVNREDRIEIKGRLTDAEKRLLTQQGAFVERINWQERVFIPAGDTGLPVFERVTASKPVVDLFERGRRNDEDSDAGVERSAQLGELGAEAFTVSTPPGESARAHSFSPSTDPQDGTPLAEKSSSEKKSFAQMVADRLIAQLAQGVAPWQKPWAPGAGGSFVPMNPTTGKRYRGINAIHLMAQQRDDSRWMTYNQAKAKGYQVRKGEKGTSVQYWKFTDEQDQLDEQRRPVLDAQGQPVKETVRLERPRVFFATVFNAEQIEGIPPLELLPIDWDPVERAEQILSASGAILRHGNQDRAFYRPGTDSIHLPEQGQFPSAGHYYATALHELGHATGHASRLDRDLSHPFGSEGYAKEELRAEIASMILGDELRIGHDPDQHAAYVGSWIKALLEDPLEIFRAAADAEKIQDYVLGLELQQEQVIEVQETQAIKDGVSAPGPVDPPMEPSSEGTEAGGQGMTDKVFLNVPYREKDMVKALGARWDRQERRWYVPHGIDPAPFAKWAATSPAGQQTSQGQKSIESTREARHYLAVPYGEHQAAKAAGALWDKAAKSWYVGLNGDSEKLKRWLPEDAPGQDQSPAMPPRDEFADALRSLGAVVDGVHPILDGQTHRIPVEGDKAGEQAGFYVGHLDGHPAGYIKNNRTGIEMTWKSKGYVLDPEQKARLQAEAAEKLQARSAELARQQEQTAERITRQMADLVPIAESTPYLNSKQIAPSPGICTDREGRTTYIPAYDAHGKVWTMQYLREDGTKRFAKDSRQEGCFHVLGGFEQLAKVPAMVIAEGYATAATISEALGHATIAAFNSGNLPHVAKSLHALYPDKPIVIAGDNDLHVEQTQGINPGRTKAEETAKAVGGKVMFPIFAPGEQSDHPKAYTDFNDLAVKSVLGKGGVERQVKAVVTAAIEKHQARREQDRREERARRQEREPRAMRR